MGGSSSDRHLNEAFKGGDVEAKDPCHDGTNGIIYLDLPWKSTKWAEFFF